MQGIILAAGRGSRLKHLTKRKPKCLNRLDNNKRFIDIILQNFLSNKIKNINIIVGYKKYLFKKLKFKKIYNEKWQSTNIFYSLSKASKILRSKSCIISYSDIIYDRTAIKLLIKEKGDIVILNNINWKKIWKLRFKNPLNDLENFNYQKTKEGKYITKIGGKVSSLSSIKGQFAGLFKISPKGWKMISEFNKLHNVNVKKLDITSFFSQFIKKNKKIIKVVDYSNSWFEIDTINDFKKYKAYKNSF